MSDWSDIGAQLRATREKLGSSIGDVAHQTRIPAHTIAELEQNDYSSFASPAYAKGFLSQYSEHLGVDANEWLDVFETDDVFSNLDSYDYLKEHEEIFGEKETPKHRVKKPAAPAASAPSLQPLVVFLVTASLVTGAVFGVMHLNEQLADKTDAPAEESLAGEETLRPVSNFPDSRPAPPKRPVVSIGFGESLVVATDKAPGLGTKGIDGGAPETVDPPAPDLILSTPPRAVIVEE